MRQIEGVRTSAALAAALLASAAASLLPSVAPPSGLPGEFAEIFCGTGAEDAG